MRYHKLVVSKVDKALAKMRTSRNNVRFSELQLVCDFYFQEQNMNLADKYTYQTAWSEEDGEFVATVLEFPSLSWLDSTAATAEAELRSVVEEALEDMQRNNERIPEPFGQRRFSGKFNLRIPQSLHRDLTIEAEREGVSLNTLIVQKLASA